MSVRELAHWVAALSRPETFPLGPRIASQLTAARVGTGDRPDGSYGYGVGGFAHDGLAVYSHSGGVPDASSFVTWIPERHVGVVALANVGGVPLAGPSFRALSTLFDLSPDWRGPSEATHPLKHYVGVYKDPAGHLGSVSVSLEQGQLVLDYVGHPPPLRASNFRFFFDSSCPFARYLATPVGVAQRLARNCAPWPP